MKWCNTMAESNLILIVQRCLISTTFYHATRTKIGSWCRFQTLPSWTWWFVLNVVMGWWQLLCLLNPIVNYLCSIPSCRGLLLYLRRTTENWSRATIPPYHIGSHWATLGWPTLVHALLLRGPGIRLRCFSPVQWAIACWIVCSISATIAQSMLWWTLLGGFVSWCNSSRMQKSTWTASMWLVRREPWCLTRLIRRLIRCHVWCLRSRCIRCVSCKRRIRSECLSWSGIVRRSVMRWCRIDAEMTLAWRAHAWHSILVARSCGIRCAGSMVLRSYRHRSWRRISIMVFKPLK
jgi:hypothetical protein